MEDCFDEIMKDIRNEFHKNSSDNEWNRPMFHESNSSRGNGRGESFSFFTPVHAIQDAEQSFSKMNIKEYRNFSNESDTMFFPRSLFRELIQEQSESIETVKKSPLRILYDSRPNVKGSADFHVIKINNIGLETTRDDIVDFFEPFTIPRFHEPPHYTEGVHLIINRDSQRLLGCCFVEVPDIDSAKDMIAAKAKGRQYLRGKMVHVQLSTQNELKNTLFPKFYVRSNKTDIESGGVFLRRSEIFSLLELCKSIRYRNYKMKPLERPFESIISIISKVPWHDPEGISTLQRDHLFELLKLSVESLKASTLSKSFSGLISRMIRAGLCVPLFTEKQKFMLLNSAQMQCPKDLMPFVYMPEETEDVKDFSPTSIKTATTDSTIVQELHDKLSYSDKNYTLLQKAYLDLEKKYQDLVFDYNKLLELNQNPI